MIKFNSTGPRPSVLTSPPLQTLFGDVFFGDSDCSQKLIWRGKKPLTPTSLSGWMVLVAAVAEGACLLPKDTLIAGALRTRCPYQKNNSDSFRHF